MVWHLFLQTSYNIYPGLLVMLISTPFSIFQHTYKYSFSPELGWTGTPWRMKFTSNLHSLSSSHHYLPATEYGHGTPAVTGVCPLRITYEDLKKIYYKLLFIVIIMLAEFMEMYLEELLFFVVLYLDTPLLFARPSLCHTWVRLCWGRNWRYSWNSSDWTVWTLLRWSISTVQFTGIL